MFTLVLDQNQISDLFFNHENKNFAELFIKGDGDAVTRQAMEVALTEDAEAFAALAGYTRGGAEYAKFVAWLVEDYLERAC